MDNMKVLVVDDSTIYRKILSIAVTATGIAETPVTASNGNFALERLEYCHFDAVLMDVNMPELDGIETLKIIKQKYPDLPVIMISGAGAKNVQTTFDALQCGAMDFILKPSDNDYNRNLQIISNYLKVIFSQIQIKKLQMPSKVDYQTIQSGCMNEKIEKSTISSKRIDEPLVKPPISHVIQKDSPADSKMKFSAIDLVLIASSTGGPVALEKILNNFGKEFEKPMLIVQHMPPEFTGILAESLDRKSQLRIIEGKEGDMLRAGQAIIAPGGSHMIVCKSGVNKKISLTKSKHVNGVRPAADVLFTSVASEYRNERILVVILTGMGCDGLAGVRELKKQCSCYCITQSEASCVVYGMPKCVDESGLSDESIEIGKIAARIQQISERGC